MKKLPLNKDDVVQLNSRLYTIESVIGDGATCIVYSAYYRDGLGLKHRVNLKECYPYSANISREQQVLTWNAEEERDQWLDSFQNAYEKLMTWQNAYDTVNVFDLCEANNTLYIIMNADKGKTFDKDQPESLRDILNTVKLLAHSVGRYHENGYLHLDVKPSNFLVYPRPIEHIVLFDLDSVTSMDDIRAGKMKGVSYSDGWAAPEQKQRKISRLCPATDIFAIGAILFEKVMGRQVEAFDMGVFAEWNFEGELFEDVNPKIKRLLREVFHKTLAANIKRRYQTTDELIAALNQAINVVIDGKPYLTTNCPPLTTQFIGRRSEIRAINQAFQSSKRAVFLHGDGGIGKSQLATAYASYYQNEYDSILFLRYRDSLEDLVEGIEIQNYDSGEREKKKTLRRLMDKHILLIIDNFDVELDRDDYLEELLQFKACIIVTTRTDFSRVFDGETIQLEVGQLPNSDLIQLFCRASGIVLSEEQKPYLNGLLKSVDFNTYATELLGLQIAASGCSLETLASKVVNGLDGLCSSEKVWTKKDGHTIKRKVPEIIRVLFRISNLDEPRKQVLRNMYLLRFMNVDRSTYARFTYESAPGIDALNDMLELGWVRNSGQFFTLHPLVEELVKNDLNPNKDNCSGVYCAVSEKIRNCCEFDYDSEAGEQKYESDCDFLCAFFESIPLEQEYNRHLLLSWALGIIENESAQIGSPVDSCFSNLYRILENLIADKKLMPMKQ